MVHGKRMIEYAHKSFDCELDGSLLGLKLPGIHWQMDAANPDVSAPRAAEICVGIINSDLSESNGYGYNPVMKLVSSFDDVVLHFTCVEMNEKFNPADSSENTSLSYTLAHWIGTVAKKYGVIVKGENALNRDNDTFYAWNNIDQHIKNDNYHGVTFLRIQDVVYGPSADYYRQIIKSALPEAVQTEYPASVRKVTVYYKPNNTEQGMYLHSWNNGLNGSMGLDKADDGWWKIDINPSPDQFTFCFRNRPNGPDDFQPWDDENVHWDGINRTYNNNGDTVYIYEGDTTVYTAPKP